MQKALEFQSAVCSKWFFARVRVAAGHTFDRTAGIERREKGVWEPEIDANVIRRDLGSTKGCLHARIVLRLSWLFTQLCRTKNRSRLSLSD